MVRVLSDFNERTKDGLCFILKYEGVDLADQLDKLKLSKGAKVVLYPHEDDFEVTATLDKQYVDVFGQEVWVAVPHWDTLVRK